MHKTGFQERVVLIFCLPPIPWQFHDRISSSLNLTLISIRSRARRSRWYHRTVLIDTCLENRAKKPAKEGRILRWMHEEERQSISSRGRSLVDFYPSPSTGLNKKNSKVWKQLDSEHFCFPFCNLLVILALHRCILFRFYAAFLRGGFCSLRGAT